MLLFTLHKLGAGLIIKPYLTLMVVSVFNDAYSFA